MLVVGINNYWDSDLKLNYSVPDAKSIAQKLKHHGEGLFKKVEIVSLLDEKGTRKELHKAFKTLSKRVHSYDVFVFYMAGHGVAMDGRYHFIPWKFQYINKDSVAEHALVEKDLQSWLAMIPALKSLVIMDTCNSGAFSIVASRSGLAEKGAIDRLMRSTGRAFLAASTKEQVAMEGIGGHGVFTYALLNALGGEADRESGNRDGETDINELAKYVGDTVPSITHKKWGYRQIPMQDLQGQSFPIGMVR